MRTKLIATLSAVGCALLVAGPAYAGAVVPQQVLIFDFYAFGNVASAYDSPDSTQYIGCYDYAAEGGAAYTYCYARSSSGENRICRATGQQQTVARTINDISFVYFLVYDGATECHFIQIDRGSRYLE